MTCVAPDSATALAHLLQTEMWEAVEADNEVLVHFAKRGMNDEIREVLKGYSDQDSKPQTLRARQLEFFPEELRSTVEQIGRASVFVPSREEFVELVPDAITTPEMREAGLFLIGKGEDCIRRGKALLRLAGLLEEAA